SILYGLHLARAAIAKQDRAVVVEGNTDVIALRQVGLEPVVASMGTALTEKQLRELGRLTRRLFLCFDSDAAGEDATLRGMELALAEGFDVKVVTLSPRLIEFGERLELNALAGVRKHPQLGRILAELGPAHFDDAERMRAVPVILGLEEPDARLKSLLAELDARAEDEAIDEPTTEQLLLRLRERRLQRELAEAEDERLPDLQQALARVRERIREFA